MPPAVRHYGAERGARSAERGARSAERGARSAELRTEALIVPSFHPHSNFAAFHTIVQPSHPLSTVGGWRGEVARRGALAKGMARAGAVYLTFV